MQSTDEVEKLYPTEKVRIWCRAIRDIEGYEVLFVFNIDPAHRYSNEQLTDLDAEVKSKLHEVGEVSEENAETYLNQFELFDENDIQEMIGELN